MAIAGSNCRTMLTRLAVIRNVRHIGEIGIASRRDAIAGAIK